MRTEDPTLLDRVYAVLHQMESEQLRRKGKDEGDDWLDGVSTGRQAEKRELIERLHWILDTSTHVVDLTLAGPLVTRLNERHDPAKGKGAGEYPGYGPPRPR